MSRQNTGPLKHSPAWRCAQAVFWCFRRLTRTWRVLPDYIIIGAQKGGTTSLLRYIEAHRLVIPAAAKEIHFFDHFSSRGLAWYRSFFPTRLYRNWAAKKHGRPLLIGEASPYYLFHPRAAERAFATVPAAELIAMLRNPVDRAFSHYHHEVRWGFEDAPTFVDAIDREEERLAGERDRMLADESYEGFNHNHYSYLARGRYLGQLEAWRKFFPEKQLLVLKSEEFFAETRSVFDRVLRFLELPSDSRAVFEPYNYAINPEMERSTRQRLVEYYKPHNLKLYEYLGQDLGWDA